uniref:AlNc14C174G8082 protein n=1 Tax=Albugo laibachii Nc14 TaxID=890382 RepID=F0WNS0_9STRA|nr:AlNc14C174G8082 [Albugo laibachii Nc14]|eukprot:CCA22962.1 AlNc14C174G8082 [Albugo laibachii Nc14]
MTIDRILVKKLRGPKSGEKLLSEQSLRWPYHNKSDLRPIDCFKQNDTQLVHNRYIVPLLYSFIDFFI